MFTAPLAPAAVRSAVVPHVGWRALVVDDSRLQRRILAGMLSRWGYEVTEAASGAEALNHARTTGFDLVVSDWLMPGMTGVEFCRAFRAIPAERYCYFILVTANSGRDEVAKAFDVGADDFVTKPVPPREFRARIAAGERIIDMQRCLSESNRRLNDTLAEMRMLHESLERDLVEARKLQQSLVRDRFRDFGPAALSVLLRPSGHVGGDLAGFFPIGGRRIGFFSVDVAGHGVAAALMTARLSGLFSPKGVGQNVALAPNRFGTLAPRRPRDVAMHLNRVFLEEMETEQYFTMIYADADMVSGEVTFVQAGHPNPAVVRADGRVEFPGGGGFPVGLLAEAEYEETKVTLQSGDRLLLLTDGITECGSAAGGVGEADIARILRANQKLDGPRYLDALVADLAAFAGIEEFPDDISCTLFEFGKRGVQPS